MIRSIALATLIGWVSLAPQVSAMTAPMSEAELADAADLIVHGHISEVLCQGGPVTDGPWTTTVYHAILTIDSAIKPAGNELAWVTLPFAISGCEGEDCMPGMCGWSPSYQVGERGLYYLATGADTELYTLVSWNAFVADEDSAGEALPTCDASSMEDPECGDGEGCPDGQTCVWTGEQSECLDDQEPEPEWEPECESDNDCDEGQTCTWAEEGAEPECLEPEPEWEPECEDDSDCPDGQTCTWTGEETEPECLVPDGTDEPDEPDDGMDEPDEPDDGTDESVDPDDETGDGTDNGPEPGCVEGCPDGETCAWNGETWECLESSAPDSYDLPVDSDDDPPTPESDGSSLESPRAASSSGDSSGDSVNLGVSGQGAGGNSSGGTSGGGTADGAESSRCDTHCGCASGGSQVPLSVVVLALCAGVFMARRRTLATR